MRQRREATATSSELLSLLGTEKKLSICPANTSDVFFTPAFFGSALSRAYCTSFSSLMFPFTHSASSTSSVRPCTCSVTFRPEKQNCFSRTTTKLNADPGGTTSAKLTKLVCAPLWLSPTSPFRYCASSVASAVMASPVCTTSREKRCTSLWSS